MKDLNGREIPDRPEKIIESLLYRKYKETKDVNYRFGDFGTFLTTECTVLTCRNIVTYGYIIIRIWYTEYPRIKFDVLGHQPEVVDFVKPTLEKYAKEMTEYYSDIRGVVNGQKTTTETV